MMLEGNETLGLGFWIFEVIDTINRLRCRSTVHPKSSEIWQ